jgi:acyl phosphate:glycerol-3-phosphate acyltransferase
VVELVTKTLISYLLGSLIGSLVVGKLYGGIDIRTQGSGNAGGTNALRTQGWWFALWVMIVDIGKGWLAGAVIPQLELFNSSSSSSTHVWMPVICASAAVVGHVYPVFFGFRGGKGAATLLGVVFGVQHFAALIVMAIWTASLLLTGYVGLSTMLATAGFTLYQLLSNSANPLFWFGLVMTAFVIFTHRANITRMRTGTENRSTRFWLLRPR